MKIAVFPGSFDPITLAHADIVKRALSLFDRIYIAVGINSTKKGMLSPETRKQIIEAVFSATPERILVAHYEGLTVDFCRRVGATHMLRGLRSVSDFEFENAIAQNNLFLAPDMETVFLVSTPGLAHISSTIVRDVLRHKGDISRMVPPAAADLLKSASETYPTHP